MNKLIRTLFILSCCFVLILGCRKDGPFVVSSEGPQAFSGEVAREWFDLQCKIVKQTPGFFPTQGARAFGYAGIALYETVVQGWNGAPRLAGQISDLSKNNLPIADVSNHQYNWAIAANAALADMMRKLFELNITPENQEAIDQLESEWKSQLSIGITDDEIKRSEQFGKMMAAAIFEYSINDGGHRAYLDPFEMNNPYEWPQIEGAWIPTGAAQNPLSPRWAYNRPFLGQSVVQDCQPYNHVSFSTDPNSEFYKAAMEVYEIVTNHTTEQRVIAEYWADDPFQTCTPAGHTFNIMTQLLEEHKANLAMSALGYAKLGIAENDVFIACWKTKYNHFLIRPVSFIKQHIDPNFSTLIGTPPFPAYTSGHASEAAAGARIFTAMFTNGNGNYPFTDRSQLRYGFNVRNFSNFEDMARECANSRLYGGIHYDFDNQLGLSTGRAIGDAVNRKLNWPPSEFAH